MVFKKSILAYFGALLFLIVFMTAVFYVSDPYALFHRPWFDKGKMYDNLRIQNYGLIKFGNFDGIILGTSMLENTSAAEATEKLKLSYANLSLSGGSFYEKMLIAQFAVKTKHIKSVILSLDYHFDTEKRIGNSFDPDLYGENQLAGKIRTYLTGKAVFCVLLRKKCDFVKRDTDRPKAWMDLPEHARRFGGFDNWLKYANEDGQIQAALNDLLRNESDHKSEYAKYQSVTDNEILPLFKNKDTEFSIIVPPYSVFWWVKRKSELEEMMRPFEYLVEKTQDLPNVKIYWFYDDDYVFDISRYKDLAHYHPSVNSLQLNAIRNGTHILDKSNYRRKIDAFVKKVRAFDLEPYLEKIRRAKKNGS